MNDCSPELEVLFLRSPQGSAFATSTVRILPSSPRTSSDSMSNRELRLDVCRRSCSRIQSWRQKAKQKHNLGHPHLQVTRVTADDVYLLCSYPMFANEIADEGMNTMLLCSQNLRVAVLHSRPLVCVSHIHRLGFGIF